MNSKQAFEHVKQLCFSTQVKGSLEEIEALAKDTREAFDIIQENLKAAQEE